MASSTMLDCKGEGIVVPRIDIARCGAEAYCVRVCPRGVLEIGAPDDDELRSLSLVGRIKRRVRGRPVARLADAEACHACGLCVSACPHGAISLRKVSA